MHKAIRKYGAAEFRVKSIGTASLWNLICDKERIAIAKYKTFGRHGYNSTLGGDGVFGLKKSRKSRARHSEIMRQRWADPTVKARHGALMNKRWSSPGARARLSATLKQRWAGKAGKAWRNPKSRARISARVKRQWENSEARSKMIDSLKQAFADPSLRKKMSVIASRHFSSKEARAMASAATKRFWSSASTEVKNKRRAAMRAGWARRRALKALGDKLIAA